MKWILLLSLTLVGCGMKAERQQAQADAHEGVVAITDPDELVIAEGVHANIEGATGEPRPDLPPPTMTVEEIEKAPDKYRDEAVERRDSIFASGGFWAWVGGGLLTALGVLKFVPGAHQPIAAIGHALFESKSDKAAREKRDGMAVAMEVVADVIEATPDVGGLKSRIAAKLPSGAKDALDAYLKERSS